MTRHIGLTSLAAALALACANIASAAPASGPAEHGPHRAMLDSNKDGAIDRAEAAKHPRLAAMFDKLDKNSDGKLDAAERPRRHGKHGKRGGHGGMMGMIALDTDGDGRISRIEAGDGKLATRFDAVDADRDGYLVRSELRASAEQRRGEHKARRAEAMQAKFAAADADGDGRLSRAEVETHMPHLAKGFAFMDEDRDGFLTRADLQHGGHR